MKVKEVAEGEGEALRYFQHALTLKNTVQFLRKNKDLVFCGMFTITYMYMYACRANYNGQSTDKCPVNYT